MTIALAVKKDAPSPPPTSSVNGASCDLVSDTMSEDNRRVVSYRVPMVALAGKEVHQINVTAKDKNPLTIQRLEMSLGAPARNTP